MLFIKRDILLTQICGLTVFLMIGLCTSTTALAQKKIAFVAGVEKYERDGFEPLNFAEDDALQLKAELDSLGFETVAMVGPKATLAGLKYELSQLYERSKKLRKEDIVLVFLSGHGVQKLVRRTMDENSIEREEPFFCPSDAHKNDVTTLLNINDLLERLKEDSGASHNIVILDACRESLDKSGKGIDGSTIEALPNKLALFFAAQSGHRSYESRQLQHGIFTYYLLEGLRGKAADEEDEITLQGLTSYVSKRVQRDSPGLLQVQDSEAQQPNLMGNLRGSVLLGKVSQRRRMTQPEPSPTKFYTSATTGLELVLISASSAAKQSIDHEGVLANFYLGKFEVTQEQYYQVMGDNPSHNKGEKNLPVEKVSVLNAIAFCKKLTEMEAKSGSLPKGLVYRLPWKNEWNLAHGKSESRVDRNPLIEMGWFRDSNKGSTIENTSRVGSKDQNSLGIHDLYGNVAEICLNQDADDVTGDPKYLVTGGSFFVETGTFLANPDEWVAPETRRAYIGFRVLLGPPTDTTSSKP